jgi:hypothetical protein
VNAIQFFDQLAEWSYFVGLFLCFVLIVPGLRCWMHDVVLWGHARHALCTGCGRRLSKHIRT